MATAAAELLAKGAVFRKKEKPAYGRSGAEPPGIDSMLKLKRLILAFFEDMPSKRVFAARLGVSSILSWH